MDRPRIPVGDGLILTADDDQWILSKVKIRESGKDEGQPYDVPFAYCTSLRSALMRLSEHKLRTAPITTLDELGKAIQEVYDLCDVLKHVRPARSERDDETG
jgi:hypothetical protein